jgi:hypothetical protein
VACTWLCVGASKGSTILAPLYIGRAVNSLREGKADYFAILMYAGLGLSGLMFKNFQNMVTALPQTPLERLPSQERPSLGVPGREANGVHADIGGDV